MNLAVLSILAAAAAWQHQKKKKQTLVETFMPPLSFKLDHQQQPVTSLEYTSQRDLVRRPPVLPETPVQTASNYAAMVNETPIPPPSYLQDVFVAADQLTTTDNGASSVSYTVPSTGQSGSLPARFSNLSYGANINYRPPNVDILAVNPQNPLAYSADGELQPIVHDRYIYAPKRSRLQFAGDPIRGDLPIMPLQGNWFAPAVTPSLDLREGALSVIGGRHNDTSNELAEMKYRQTGGAWNINGGTPYRLDDTLVRETGGATPLYRQLVNNAGDVTVATMY